MIVSFNTNSNICHLLRRAMLISMGFRPLLSGHAGFFRGLAANSTNTCEGLFAQWSCWPRRLHTTTDETPPAPSLNAVRRSACAQQIGWAIGVGTAVNLGGSVLGCWTLGESLSNCRWSGSRNQKILPPSSSTSNSRTSVTHHGLFFHSLSTCVLRVTFGAVWPHAHRSQGGPS